MTVKRLWEWTVAILAAIVALAAAVFTFGRRKEAEGETLGGLEADRKRAEDAAKAGDDEQVLEEWRRQQKP